MWREPQRERKSRTCKHAARAGNVGVRGLGARRAGRDKASGAGRPKRGSQVQTAGCRRGGVGRGPVRQAQQVRDQGRKSTVPGSPGSAKPCAVGRSQTRTVPLKSQCGLLSRPWRGRDGRHACGLRAAFIVAPRGSRGGGARLVPRAAVCVLPAFCCSCLAAVHPRHGCAWLRARNSAAPTGACRVGGTMRGAHKSSPTNGGHGAHPKRTISTWEHTPCKPRLGNGAAR